jgi:hypothetical protein
MSTTMTTLYHAANAIEAHMIVQLLSQEGVTAHIEGEHLQGALGELPAAGLVRVVLDTADYAQGRALIDRWEAQQPELTASNTAHPARGRSGSLLGGIIGVVIGLALGYGFFRVPVYENGLDYDRDGVLDEKWTYSAARIPLTLEADRNLDHKTDYIAHYDAQGHLEWAHSDDNFDGVFETKLRYRNGNLQYSETDTDGDGYPDLRAYFTHGVMHKTEYINPANGQMLRAEYFKLGKLTMSEMDTDKDGKLDTRYMYSALGQVVSSESMASQ